ncbi:fatty-acid-binding protein 3, chloroplastic isoform X2 [Vigna radiata var. radiata]|uniref:Chalcone-flavonone isomerase family protein n=1 Tax=Vigna radiata var. radiata TaxID=3916 RepID=A0A1S3U8V2_VIGRR|nr:fatty-acid-binding protein 3, chloroplastic isoform X2 [Vigna radiata var. radiata]
MLGAVAASTALCFSPSTPPTRIFVHRGVSNSTLPLSNHGHSFSLLSSTPMHFSSLSSRRQPLFLTQAASSSAANAEYVEEPATNVKFQTCLNFPGCSNSLTLFGTGYREKVFAIIGVKVYAAASFEKSLQIILVRDVDGQTFWDALSDAIAPRIPASTSADETALTTFRGVFLDRSLKKGTFILLTWLNPTKLLVSVSPNRFPSTVDATIESANVASALFNVFLGDSPVSPSLKSSVAEGLSKVLK